MSRIRMAYLDQPHAKHRWLGFSEGIHTELYLSARVFRAEIPAVIELEIQPIEPADDLNTASRFVASEQGFRVAMEMNRACAETVRFVPVFDNDHTDIGDLQAPFPALPKPVPRRIMVKGRW